MITMKWILLMMACIYQVSGYGRPKNAFLATTVPTTVPTTTTIMYDEYEDFYPNGRGQNENTFENAKTIMKSLHVTSNIQFRYAQTTIDAYMKNPSAKSREMTFSVILPDSAFVSNFSMILRDNQEFVGRVMEKKKATDAYKEALQNNGGAGLVQTNTRNANQIMVSVNVEPRGKAKFRLTYEDLLKRHLSKYQHVIHINLDQVVEDFKVQVFINESLPVVRVHVPDLKTDPNAIDSPTQENRIATVEKGDDPNKVKITFQPDAQTQKKLLESQDDKEGIHGQFIVEYDVDRKSHGNDVQVLDGYFVHFFAPESLVTLPKHVIFVLDISGSMYGEKLQQTKDAMVTILDDLTDKDHFNIISFSDSVTHWVPDAEKNLEAPHSLTHRGTKELRDEALRYVLKLYTLGGTNIHDAMLEALKLVTEVKQAETAVPKNTNPIIVFLTDGEPTTGITSGSDIELRIAEANEKLEVPIYGLAFGKGADFALIKSISLKSGAYAKKIFEGSDAAIQLEDFYLELANPLLNNVKFEYVGEPFKNGSLTNTNFKTFFKGSEYVIAGQITDLENEEIEVVIGGEGDEGTYEKRFNLCFLRPLPLPISVDPEENPSHVALDTIRDPSRCIYPPILPKPQPERSEAQNFIERLWAFLTIKNLLDEKLSAKEKRIAELTTHENSSSEDNSEEKFENEKPFALPSQSDVKISRTEKAIELALRYNFVTKVTSLVVTRPPPVTGRHATTVEDEGTDFKPEIAVDLSPVLDGQDMHHHGSNRRAHSIRYSHSPPSYGTYNALRSPKASLPSGRYSLNTQPVSYQPNLQHNSYQPMPTVAYDQGTPHFFKTSRGAPGHHNTFDSYPTKVKMSAKMIQSNYDATDDYEDTMVSTQFSAQQCHGKLVLYTQTYLRGRNLTTSEDVPDLEADNFDDKVTSLEVSGTCCWVLFSEPHYRGHSQQYRLGQYKSAADIGQLFRDVSSVKKIVNC